jgi:hypothetical protein
MSRECSSDNKNFLRVDNDDDDWKPSYPASSLADVEQNRRERKLGE